MEQSAMRVLFVCLGNICRSPLAEAVFRSLVQARGLDLHYKVDSAGTGAWHTGQRPDGRSVEVGRRNGVRLTGRARQIEALDFVNFDYIIAMDRQNLASLLALSHSHNDPPRFHLLREFDPDPGDSQVPDPYFGGADGFDRVYDMVLRSCSALLTYLEEERTGTSDRA